MASIEGRTFTFILRQDVTTPQFRRLSFYVFRGTDASGNTVEAEMFRGTGVTVRIYEQRFDREISATARAYVCYADHKEGRWTGYGLYGSLLPEADVVTLPSFTNRPPNCELKPAG